MINNPPAGVFVVQLTPSLVDSKRNARFVTVKEFVPVMLNPMENPSFPTVTILAIVVGRFVLNVPIVSAGTMNGTDDAFVSTCLVTGGLTNCAWAASANNRSNPEANTLEMIFMMV